MQVYNHAFRDFGKFEMQLKLDVAHYDDLQEKLIREIIEQIRFKLVQAGYSGDNLKDVTGEIAFSVASTIDDTAGVVADGVEVKPFLTFVSEDDELVHCGENSCMHELVAGLMEEVFSD